MRRGKDTADHEKGGKKRRRASEKQNMLCTEDESMIKNVSRGAGRGRGRDHVVLKGNRGRINRLEQSLMVDYGKLISNGRGGGGGERKGGSLEYSRTSWEGFGKFHFITLSF